MSKEEVARKFRGFYGESFLKNDVIAFGSGTTVGKVIELMPDRALEELSKKYVISTSRDTTYKLMEKGINVQVARRRPMVIVDGADAVWGNLFIKGGGGALLREKTVWNMTPEVFVVVTKEKIKRHVDIPVLLLPEAVPIILEMFPGARLRQGGKLPPVIDDNGLAIVDIPFELPLNELKERLDSLRPLIIEHGIFYRQKAVLIF